MPELPTGTVTFLFTDIEGSTKLWEKYPLANERIVGHGEVVVIEENFGIRVTGVINISEKANYS